MTLKIGFDGRVLANPEIRGLTRYTTGLLKALSEHAAIDLVLFCVEKPWPRHLDGIGAKVVTFSAPRESVWNDWALPKMIRREGVALFHAPADRGLPAVKVCPLIVTVHNSYERTYWRRLFPGVKRTLWYWKNEFVNHVLADAVLTVSDTTRDELRKLHVAPGHKLHRIHLAPSPEFKRRREPADDDVLRKHRVAYPYVLYVGGYDAHKNVETLVHAFSVVDLRDHLLVVVGKHKFGYARLVERWRSHPCFARLRLIEADMGDLPALYRRAAVFVNPSLWESFSFQLVEAMACGTPLLASDRSAIPEIAGKASLYFDPTDPKELAKLMEKVARDTSLQKELRVKGFDRVRTFSWKRTADETLRVYQQVLAVNGRGVF